MAYENPRNLDFSNIRKKYIHSSEILREFNAEKRIDSNFALIFSKSIAPRARRWISSWAKESSRKDAADWKVFSPESFCNYINYGKTIPLAPSEETVAFVNSLLCENKIGYDKFSMLKDNIESYWWTLKGQNLTVDMEYLADRLLSYLSSVRFPAGDEGMLCELLKEDLEGFIP